MLKAGSAPLRFVALISEPGAGPNISTSKFADGGLFVSWSE